MFKFLPKSKLFLTLLAVLILLIFLHYLKILSPLEDWTLKVLPPIQGLVYNLGNKISNFYLLPKESKKDLEQKYKILEEKVKELTIENSKLKLLAEENKELKKQLNFLKDIPYKTIPARVISRSSEPNFYILILNRGSNDGIKEGMPVITSEGILVAVINKTKKNTSQALMLSDSHSQIAATIQNESQTIGIIKGVHELSIKMELIPKNEPVGPGDIIITSGLQENIPRGLIIGQVDRVITEPNNFFQTAFIKSLTSLSELNILAILIPSIDENE